MLIITWNSLYYTGYDDEFGCKWCTEVGSALWFSAPQQDRIISIICLIQKLTPNQLLVSELPNHASV